jgi:hypothetical protein
MCSIYNQEFLLLGERLIYYNFKGKDLIPQVFYQRF